MIQFSFFFEMEFLFKKISDKSVLAQAILTYITSHYTWGHKKTQLIVKKRLSCLVSSRYKKYRPSIPVGSRGIGNGFVTVIVGREIENCCFIYLPEGIVGVVIPKISSV